MRETRAPRLRRRGMSLAETAVAASLLCLLLIGVLNLFPSALAAVGSSKQTSVANMLAQNALEFFAAKPFASLPMGTQPNTGLAVPADYTLLVEVQPVDTYSTEYLKRVRATVTWNFRAREKKVVQELYVQPVH